MKSFKSLFFSTSAVFLLSTSVYAGPLNSVQKQILAQATCVALNPRAGWTFAVARRCDNFSASCAQVCAGLKSAQVERARRGPLKCFNSLHIYDDSPSNGVNKLGLKVYKYNNCGGKCGPNFCCCSSSK